MSTLALGLDGFGGEFGKAHGGDEKVKVLTAVTLSRG